MYKISSQNIYTFFSEISARQKLYIPTDSSDGSAHFACYTDGMKLSEALNTVRSAKDFFFPQVEDIAEFKIDGQKLEIIDNRTECEDFVIFGVRPCDAKSFEILDRVYLHADPVDTYYKNRREHSTVITLACSRPAETCFCHTFGIDATDPSQGDIAAWRVDGDLVLDPLTEKGKTLLSSVSELLADADLACEDAVKAQKENTKQIFKKLPLGSLTTEKFDGRDMLKTFSDKKWAELSEACLGCGTCTFVCPTCQCYDIKEFDTGHGIKRFRCWDSCMYSDFTLMAGGHQPRLTQVERYRQRFMHKLIYFPMNNDGEYGCVGCGRCLAKCPVHTNIVKVMKAIGEENDNE